MDRLLKQVKADYPSLKFSDGETFSWSPSTGTITCRPADDEQLNTWSLLHEVAHALLGHKKYTTDFELLLLEVAAWDKARQLAKHYGIDIDEGHIQDCIDTYRDWLYQRSNCPRCSNTSLQRNAVTYNCFNCGASWT